LNGSIIVEQQVPVVECFIRPGELYRSAPVLLSQLVKTIVHGSLLEAVRQFLSSGKSPPWPIPLALTANKEHERLGLNRIGLIRQSVARRQANRRCLAAVPESIDCATPPLVHARRGRELECQRLPIGIYHPVDRDRPSSVPPAVKGKAVRLVAPAVWTPSFTPCHLDPRLSQNFVEA
jgi:hypothetical protein